MSNPEIPVSNPEHKKGTKDKSKKQKSKKIKRLKDSISQDLDSQVKIEKPETEAGSSSVQEKENTLEKPDSSQSADDAKDTPQIAVDPPRQQDPLFNAMTFAMELGSTSRIATLCLFFRGKALKGEWKLYQDVFKADPPTPTEVLAFGLWVIKTQGGSKLMPERAESLADKFELFRAKSEYDDAMRYAELRVANGILETTYEKRPPRFQNWTGKMAMAYEPEDVDTPDEPVGRETPEQIKQRIDGIAALVAQFSVPIRDD